MNRSANSKMITMARDQVVNVHVTGFPKEWSTTQKKEYIYEQTKSEILDVSQYGKKTMFCFKKVDLKLVITSLNGCMIDNEHKIQIQNVTSKSEHKNMEVAEVLHELAAYNWVTPLLDRQQFYLLEKSLRTLYVGNLPQVVSDTDIQNVFSKYGSVEDVSLVLNLETGEHRGFAFVVFDQHEICDHVYQAAKLISINGHLVKIQKSKPSKAVAELAKQAGLYDSEGNVTPLLEQLLAAAKQVILLQQQQDQGGGQYIQDPNSGQIFMVSNAQPQLQQQQMIANVNQVHPTIPALTPTSYVISANNSSPQLHSRSHSNIIQPPIIQQQMQSQLLQQVLQQQQIGQRLLVQQQLQQQWPQQLQQQQNPLAPQLQAQMPIFNQQHLLQPQLAAQQILQSQQFLQAQQMLQSQQLFQQQHQQTIQTMPQNHAQAQMHQNAQFSNQQQQQHYQNQLQAANQLQPQLQQQQPQLQQPQQYQNHQLHPSFQQIKQPQMMQQQQPLLQNNPMQNNPLQNAGAGQPMMQMPNTSNAINTNTPPHNNGGLPPQLAPALPPTQKKVATLQNQTFMNPNVNGPKQNLSGVMNPIGPQKNMSVASTSRKTGSKMIRSVLGPSCMNSLNFKFAPY